MPQERWHLSGRREQCSLPGLARRSAPLAAHKSGQAPNVTRRVPAVRHRPSQWQWSNGRRPRTLVRLDWCPGTCLCCPGPAMDCQLSWTACRVLFQILASGNAQWSGQHSPSPGLRVAAAEPAFVLLHTAKAQLDAYTGTSHCSGWGGVSCHAMG